MTREADVVKSLVEMADTLVDDYDIVDLLTGVADRCVSLLGVSAAGVMLASPAGRLGLVASSSEAMRLLELFELQQQEGPCLDAFRTGERVGHENLDAGSGRWPLFSAAARKAGFASASALPLRLREVTLGALNLLSVTRAPMAEADVIVARAFADLAALSIAQHRASAEAQRLNEQLSGALTSRVVIEQAKGVICERAGVDLAEAFSRLRAYARNHNRRLTDVAQAAIDGTLDPLAWAAVKRLCGSLANRVAAWDGVACGGGSSVAKYQMRHYAPQALRRLARARAGDAAPSPRSPGACRPAHRRARHGQHRTAEPDRLHERQRSPACPRAAGACTAAVRMHGKCSFDGSRRILPGQRPGTALSAWRRPRRLPAQEPDPNRCTAVRAIAVAVHRCT